MICCIDVLILHLKRLVINSTGGGKIRTLVKVPIENLDVSPFLCGMLASMNIHIYILCLFRTVCVCMQ